ASAGGGPPPPGTTPRHNTPPDPADNPGNASADERRRPSSCRDSSGAAQSKRNECKACRRRRRLAEDRYGARACTVPTRVPKQRSCERVPRSRAETAQRLGGPQRVQQFRGLALPFFLLWSRRRSRDRLQKCLERIDFRCRHRLSRSLRLRLTAHRQGPPFREAHCLWPVILFFKNLRKNEPVTVTRDGADETRFARVVAKRSTDRPNRLT